MGQWALGVTWHQFPQGLGEPGVLCLSLPEWGPLTAPVCSSTWLWDLLPLPLGLRISVISLSPLLSPLLCAQCLFTTHFFLSQCCFFFSTHHLWLADISLHSLPASRVIERAGALSSSLQVFAVGFKLLTPLYHLLRPTSFLVSVMSLLLANASRWTPLRLQKEHRKHTSVQQRARQGEPQNQHPNPWHLLPCATSNNTQGFKSGLSTF